MSGDEYFLTFIDENTYYVWVYVLKWKDGVFSEVPGMESYDRKIYWKTTESLTNR